MYPLSQRITRPAFDFISPFLALPELRAFWPMSSVNESGNALDLSGQARTLTNNATTLRVIYEGFVNYFNFNGSTQYLSRADEAGLDITGALTLGGWFWTDSITFSKSLLSKDNVSAGTRSYLLYDNGGSSELGFLVSGDGTAGIFVLTPTGKLTSGQWHFCLGRYTPSTEIAVFIDNQKTTNVTSIPASLFNGATNFTIGTRSDAGASFLNGRATLCFLCADDLPDVLIQSLFAQTRSFFDV